MLINMLSQAVMVNSEAINRLLLKHAGNPERSPRVSVNEANNLVAAEVFFICNTIRVLSVYTSLTF